MAIAQNHLIELLPRKARLSLLSLCEPVKLVLSSVLSNSGTRTHHVYFPIDGFISLVNEIDGKPVLEVGMVGREGMLGVHVALGVTIAPSYAVVQGSGAAWRVALRPFVAELARNESLRRTLSLYTYTLMSQLATTASCLRFHQIGPRLARWLLMTQDRAHCDSFCVTHQFLAYMLGVRREGVTAAARLLQHRGLIKYHRGMVHILDTQALQAAACTCYANDQDIYERFLRGSTRRK